MTPDISLFQSLLGDTWTQLGTAVQRMHGSDAQVRTRGIADVQGASHLPARALRWLLGLPQPGASQLIEVTMQRDGLREVWTRRFATGRMRSELDRAAPPLLRERLGPVTLRFALLADGQAIDWQLRRVHLLGIPVPRAWHGAVLARSGTRDGRYEFHIDARLPLVGQLVAYQGWLEITDVC